MPKTLNTDTHRSGRFRGQIRAFSLIEVVIALGIFALGITAVIGLLQPVIMSVRASMDANSANRIVGSINQKLTNLGYVSAQNLAFPAGTDPLQVSPNDSKLIYATLTGDKVGVDADPVWVGTPKNQRYFEIMLVRSSNANLSPVDSNPTTSSYSFVVTAVRVSSPAYLGTDNSPIITPRANRSTFIYNTVVTR